MTAPDGSLGGVVETIQSWDQRSLHDSLGDLAPRGGMYVARRAAEGDAETVVIQTGEEGRHRVRLPDLSSPSSVEQFMAEAQAHLEQVFARPLPRCPLHDHALRGVVDGEGLASHGLEAGAGGDSVADVDRAKTFYTERAGFSADHDHTVSEDIRFVQLTPPGSGCSIALGKGLTDAAPGSVRGMQMTVASIDEARAELVVRGVDASEIQTFAWGKFVFFSDPDGNRWAVQEIPARG